MGLKGGDTGEGVCLGGDTGEPGLDKGDWDLDFALRGGESDCFTPLISTPRECNGHCMASL